MNWVKEEQLLMGARGDLEKLSVQLKDMVVGIGASIPMVIYGIIEAARQRKWVPAVIAGSALLSACANAQGIGSPEVNPTGTAIATQTARVDGMGSVNLMQEITVGPGMELAKGSLSREQVEEMYPVIMKNIPAGIESDSFSAIKLSGADGKGDVEYLFASDTVTGKDWVIWEDAGNGWLKTPEEGEPSGNPIKWVPVEKKVGVDGKIHFVTFGGGYELLNTDSEGNLLAVGIPGVDSSTRQQILIPTDGLGGSKGIFSPVDFFDMQSSQTFIDLQEKIALSDKYTLLRDRLEFENENGKIMTVPWLSIDPKTGKCMYGGGAVAVECDTNSIKIEGSSFTITLASGEQKGQQITISDGENWTTVDEGVEITNLANFAEQKLIVPGMDGATLTAEKQAIFDAAPADANEKVGFDTVKVYSETMNQVMYTDGEGNVVAAYDAESNTVLHAILSGKTLWTNEGKTPLVFNPDYPAGKDPQEIAGQVGEYFLQELLARYKGIELGNELEIALETAKQKFPNGGTAILRAVNNAVAVGSEFDKYRAQIPAQNVNFGASTVLEFRLETAPIDGMELVVSKKNGTLDIKGVGISQGKDGRIIVSYFYKGDYELHQMMAFAMEKLLYRVSSDEDSIVVRNVAARNGSGNKPLIQFEEK